MKFKSTFYVILLISLFFISIKSNTRITDAATTTPFKDISIVQDSAMDNCSDNSQCSYTDQICNNGPSDTDSGGCGDACNQGAAWSRYAVKCKVIDTDPITGEEDCDDRLVYSTSVYSTADKCSDGSADPPAESYLRSGTCEGGIGGIFKTCCTNDTPSRVSSNSCVSVEPYNSGPFPPYDGVCPAGSTAKFCGFGTNPACGQAACGNTSTPTPTPTPTPTDVYYCSGNTIRHKKSDGSDDYLYCNCDPGSGITDCQGTTCEPYGTDDAHCVTPPAGCNTSQCTSWTNGSCGGGGCPANQRQQTRSCPSGSTCSTSQCVPDSSCTTSGSCGGDGQAACCDQNQVNMGISPNPVNAGNQISFSINGSQGSTRFNDTWSGGTDCSGGFWNSTKTCNATSAVTNATWTHTWRNCMPNDGSCDQNGYQTCSKSVPYTINPGIPNPPSSVTASCPIPGTQATINITASAGATKYALRMKDTAIGWGTPTSCSDSDNLLTGSICNDNITTTTYSFTSTKNQTSLAGHTYGGWVHACNSSGCSGATYTNPSAFTCIVVPPTPTVDTTKLSCITSADTSSTNGSKIDISWTNTNNIIPITWIDIIDNAGSYFHKDVRGLTPGPDGKIHTDGTEFSWFAGTPTPNPTLTFNANTTYTIRSWNNYVNSATAPFPISPIPLCSCEGGIGACGSAINSDPDPNSIATCDGTWTHDFMGDEWCAVNVNATRNRCYRCGASIGPWIQTTGDVHSNTGINAPGGP